MGEKVYIFKIYVSTIVEKMGNFSCDIIGKKNVCKIFLMYKKCLLRQRLRNKILFSISYPFFSLKEYFKNNKNIRREKRKAEIDRDR